MLSEIHKLEREEYDILRSIEEGFEPDPDNSIALIATNDCSIVGRMLLIHPAHIEGTWVKEEFRKGTTGIRLMRRMEEEAKRLGLSKLFSYAETPEIEDYLERLGYVRKPLSVWEKEL